ncbi:MAG: alpha/beta hydrolase [Rhizobiaceae bacterium]|nr:alpha/beta hydrolase [Rhizobiaceae bacterium]
MSTDAYHHNHVGAGADRPLLFLFHGTGGNEDQFMDIGAALIPRATLVAPRGDVSEQGAARYFRRAAEGIYDMGDLTRATGKMAGFVRAHIDSAKPSSVHGLGYSNGANILANVIFANPGLFDTATLMHPLIPFAPEIDGLLSTRILITAGRADPICPPELTAQLETALLGAGADLRTVWHDGGHELRKGEFDAARILLADYAESAKEQIL